MHNVKRGNPILSNLKINRFNVSIVEGYIMIQQGQYKMFLFH